MRLAMDEIFERMRAKIIIKERILLVFTQILMTSPSFYILPVLDDSLQQHFSTGGEIC